MAKKLNKPQQAAAKSGAPAPNPDAVNVKANGPGDGDNAMARTLLRPTVTSAIAIRTAHKEKNGISNGPSIEALTTELVAQCNAVTDGNMARPEAMLTAQAHTLDTLFSDLVRRAYSHTGLDPFERIMRLALRVQGQARATVETLAAIKNPPIVFAKQANVTTGPQQINNGRPAELSDQYAQARTHAGKVTTAQNGLLENGHGERLEPITTGRAVGGDPEMATVGTVNRAAHR